MAGIWNQIKEYFIEIKAVLWIEKTREEYGVAPNSHYAKLPKWALIAYAARNARRIYCYLDAIGITGQVLGLEDVILAMEHSATAAHCKTEMLPGPVNIPERFKNNQIIESCIMTINNAYKCLKTETKEALKCYSQASECGSVAYLSIGCGNGNHISYAIVMYTRKDLLKLVNAAKNWDDFTPVPPEFFGPLWPEGYPRGWPK